MDSLPPLVSVTLGGVLAAAANLALGSRAILLPRFEGSRLRLGFLAQLFVCVGVAHAVDHDFRTAFYCSLCGTAILRHVKGRIERVFEEGTAPDHDRPE